MSIARVNQLVDQIHRLTKELELAKGELETIKMSAEYIWELRDEWGSLCVVPDTLELKCPEGYTRTKGVVVLQKFYDLGGWRRGEIQGTDVDVDAIRVGTDHYLVGKESKLFPWDNYLKHEQGDSFCYPSRNASWFEDHETAFARERVEVDAWVFTTIPEESENEKPSS